MRIKQITILILTIAVAVAVSGCIKKIEKPIVNNSNDQQINQEQKKEFECGIIKEANGWKRYRNEYWGVEFSFRDEGDNFKISQGCKSNIVISENSERLNPYIYIYFYKNDFKFNQKQQANLKEYLEAGGWDNHTELAELISIKELTNNNGLTFIETIANVSGGRQFSGYYKVSSYYMEYNKMKDKNYIYIRGPALNSPDLYKKWKVIIDTFKFID